MAASSNFDPSSGSPDRPLYASGQRSYLAASLDRSSSFHENMENPILSALPSMSRSTSSVTRRDVMSFLQCMRFDPKGIIADHKLNRVGEFKRFAGLALTVPPDESLSSSLKGKVAPSSTEELKRFRIGLRESNIKARERGKIFNEGLLVIDKCFPYTPSRKRSRPDVLSGERSNVLFSSDRLVPGTSVGKLGAQGHMIPTSFELEQQMPEGSSKNVFPNKRTRMSMMDPRIDVRPDTPARSSGIVDMDKEGLKLSSKSAAEGEARTLIVGAEGWEKSNIKKKRSVIKADIALSSAATKVVNGCREPKQGVQPRLLSDGRPRSTDSCAFRPGGAYGIVVKADGISQQTSLGIHSPISRSDQDNHHSLQDRRNRAIYSDKERVSAGDINKTNTREGLSSASATSCPKLNAATRAPRSSSGIIPKPSPVIQRPMAAKDWELSHCKSKNLATADAGNHKRIPSTKPSSPPVAQWASQRPQKMSRTARPNFVPIVSSNDETPSLDTISDAVGSENGSGFSRGLSGNSPRQVKLKGDRFVSATLSESEESGTAEVKSRDKKKKSSEFDDKSGKNIHKVSPLLPPPWKNKVASREDIGDSIRKQGRTGRNISSPRSLMPLTLENHGSMGTAKQLRSAKLGFAKTESKAGRPPARKLSDRRAYARQKQTTLNSSADFLDDGQEELFAAANSIINPAYAISSSFWSQIEPLFRLISDVDLADLKQQRDRAAFASTPKKASFGRESRTGISMFEHVSDMCITQHSVLDPADLALGAGMSSEVSLCQILLSALISEDVNEEPCDSGNEDELCTHESDSGENGQIEYAAFNHRSAQSFELAGHTGLDGYRLNSIERSYSELEHDLSDKDAMSSSDMWISSGFDLFRNGFLPDHSVIPVSSSSDIEYNEMSFNERALLEIQSIGLSAERLPDLVQTGDEEISRDISRLEDKYHNQVCRKKDLLDKLSKSTCEARDLQEKWFEEAALDRLIGMAYKKYMGCWGRNAPGGKTASSKVAKQAALAFVKRTLERCRQFELTGKSCFSEPFFKEMFHSRLSQLSDTQHVAVNTNGVNALQSPSLSNRDMYSSGPLLSMDSPFERTIGNEDTWSNRVKKRELLLDDVVGGVIGTSSITPLGIGASLSSSVKGKRSERDREGKGNNRDVLSRNGATKIGRTTSGNVKGERKTKSKPKQKTTQLSAVNGLIAKMSEQPKTGLYSMPNPGETRSSSSTGKEENNFKLDASANSEGIDFSGMDVLDVPGDLGDQGEDFGSWLSIVDDGLPDGDFMGLEIPMDDLSELNMMV